MQLNKLFSELKDNCGNSEELKTIECLITLNQQKTIILTRMRSNKKDDLANEFKDDLEGLTVTVTQHLLGKNRPTEKEMKAITE